MRMLGIAAIFLLSLCAIVEGAFLFRLSRQIRDLSADVATARDGLPRVIVAPSDPSSRPSLPPSRPSAPVRAALPAVPVFAPAGPTGTATATLRDALATPEGRDQLRNAMDVIAEQRRQERLVDYVKRREEREQRWRDRIGKVLPLNPEESTKLNGLFADLQNGRRQLIEDMKAGGKTADETDTALDELRDNTQRNIHALLGDDRWSKVRRVQGDGQGGQGGTDQQGQGQQGQGQGQGQGGRRRGGGPGRNPAAAGAAPAGAPPPG